MKLGLHFRAVEEGCEFKVTLGYIEFQACWSYRPPSLKVGSQTQFPQASHAALSQSSKAPEDLLFPKLTLLKAQNMSL